MDGTTWYFELVSADENEIVVCHYQQGSECSAATQISYLPKRPKVTLTVPPAVNGGGQLSPNVQQSFWYQNVGFEIIPDDGYVLDTIEGCDGYVEGNHYIAFASNIDCEINATFKEQQQTVGSFIIGNQDLYFASAYTLELNADNTGSLAYNGKVDITWQEDDQGVIEITPQQEFVLSEYQDFDYQDGFQVEVTVKDVAINLTLTPLSGKGSDWYELSRDIEQYKNDVLVEEYTSSYEVSKISLEQRIAIHESDITGEWSIDLVGEDTVYKVLFNQDGTGHSHNLIELNDESFTWQVVDNSIALTFSEDGDTESFYAIKDLTVGYQLVTQGVFEGKHYTDSGIMVRRNEQAVSADNFAGRHQFRNGHDIATYGSGIEIYDDGELFFTFSTSSIQGSFDTNRYVRSTWIQVIMAIKWFQAVMKA